MGDLVRLLSFDVYSWLSQGGIEEGIANSRDGS
jgi:hypothetical protein